MKPTFKNNKREGRYRSFLPRSADIKIGGKGCGTIAEQTHSGLFKVRLQVWVPSTGNCPWTWVQLKYSGTDIEVCKQWVRDNWPAIARTYPIYAED